MVKKRGRKKVKAKHHKPKKKISRKKTIRKKQISVSPPVQKVVDTELSRELKSLEELGSKKTVARTDYEEKPRRRMMSDDTNIKDPLWFYIGSVFAAYLFTLSLGIFATLHFGSIEYINAVLIFLFISIASFFMVSAFYFYFKKKKKHYTVLMLFLIGLVAIMVYVSKAADTSNLVAYSIVYTILVVVISLQVLIVKK
jgi:cation transport ATPase|tara:strand:+ start:211 stop:804 length:594 start_codon:yes stop_codon:yes gene_type:complete